MLDTQLRYETSLSLISILIFTPNGTERVSLKFISFDKSSISIFHFPFCEKSIVGLLKIKSSTLPFFDFKVLKLKPVSCFIIGLIDLS